MVPLFDPLRMFLRSLDFTFKELPVDNFVIVTEPIDEPVDALEEDGIFDSKALGTETEVIVGDDDDFSDSEHEDGKSLSLDALE